MKATKYHFHEHGVGYQKGRFLQPWRPQFSVIVSWIKKNSSVLDVGCGDGVLGKKLIEEKNCQVTGLDLDENAVAEAKRHKIKARIWDLDDKLPYPDRSFDYVVASDCLQYLKQPNFALLEMFRVGKTVIIQFPNFGFWIYRLQMLTGHFPSLSLFGHTWWNSHQTRMFSLKDFLNAPVMKKKRINKIVCINWLNRKISFLSKFFPNFFGRSCILEIITL
jgi:methionine biosynthesis protein MetW